MRKIAAAVLILASSFVLTGCNGKSFKEYTPDKDEGLFKISLPASPKEGIQVSRFGPMKMFGYQEADGAYAVSFVRLAWKPEEADGIMKEAVKGLAANVKGKVAKETKIELKGEGVARDVHIEVPAKEGGQFLHARVYYLANNRLYVVSAIGKKAWVESPETAQFLDSFSSIEEEPKRATPP